MAVLFLDKAINRLRIGGFSSEALNILEKELSPEELQHTIRNASKDDRLLFNNYSVSRQDDLFEMLKEFQCRYLDSLPTDDNSFSPLALYFLNNSFSPEKVGDIQGIVSPEEKLRFNELAQSRNWVEINETLGLYTEQAKKAEESAFEESRLRSVAIEEATASPDQSNDLDSDNDLVWSYISSKLNAFDQFSADEKNNFVEEAKQYISKKINHDFSDSEQIKSLVHNLASEIKGSEYTLEDPHGAAIKFFDNFRDIVHHDQVSLQEGLHEDFGYYQWSDPRDDSLTYLKNSLCKVLYSYDVANTAEKGEFSQAALDLLKSNFSEEQVESIQQTTPDAEKASFNLSVALCDELALYDALSLMQAQYICVKKENRDDLAANDNSEAKQKNEIALRGFLSNYLFLHDNTIESILSNEKATDTIGQRIQAFQYTSAVIDLAKVFKEELSTIKTALDSNNEPLVRINLSSQAQNLLENITDLKEKHRSSTWAILEEYAMLSADASLFNDTRETQRQLNLYQDVRFGESASKIPATQSVAERIAKDYTLAAINAEIKEKNGIALSEAALNFVQTNGLSLRQMSNFLNNSSKEMVENLNDLVEKGRLIHDFSHAAMAVSGLIEGDTLKEPRHSTFAPDYVKGSNLNGIYENSLNAHINSMRERVGESGASVSAKEIKSRHRM